MNKYKYLKVIQQNFGQGWEDVSEYETDSKGWLINEDAGPAGFDTITRRNGTTYKRPISLLTHDFREYKSTGYPTRITSRREPQNIEV